MSERKRYQMLIDGEWVDGEGGKTFESVNPATGCRTVWPSCCCHHRPPVIA